MKINLEQCLYIYCKVLLSMSIKRKRPNKNLKLKVFKTVTWFLISLKRIVIFLKSIAKPISLEINTS